MKEVVMRRAMFSCIFLIFTAGAVPALADAIDRSLQEPGPMEYIEVTEILDFTGIAKEKERRAREQRQQLTRQSRREQLQLLRETLLKRLQQFRTDTARTPASDEQEAERAEAEKKHQQQEAS